MQTKRPNFAPRLLSYSGGHIAEDPDVPREPSEIVYQPGGNAISAMKREACFL